MSGRDQAVFKERMRGSTLRAIGDRHDLTPEGVRVVVAKEGRRQIDELELRLMANRRTGEIEAFIVPDHAGPDFDIAIAYFQWAMRELDKRGVAVQVTYRPAHNGVVFGVEDITDYASKEDR